MDCRLRSISPTYFRAAFTPVAPKSVRIQSSCQYEKTVYALGIYWCKSCSYNVDEIDTWAEENIPTASGAVTIFQVFIIVQKITTQSFIVPSTLVAVTSSWVCRNVKDSKIIPINLRVKCDKNQICLSRYCYTAYFCRPQGS